MEQDAPKAVMRVFNGDMKIGSESMTTIFLHQLDNIYCIKKHLVNVLPSFADKASFHDLKMAILENLDEIKLQILRMEVIYKMLNKERRDVDCVAVKTMSLEAYLTAKVDEQTPVERDLSLLIHLQITESVEIAYFSVLKNISETMNNPEVETLVKQNFDTSVNSKKLYELIAREYIS